MHHRTTACFLILLLLCCGLKCNTDVAHVVLPEVTDTSETTPLFEMEAILATRGEVTRPSPMMSMTCSGDTGQRRGLSTPRDYYTKYIDAGGIAIVGGNLVEDSYFQQARHIALVMTSKVPGLRDALSYNQPGGISGGEVPFRLVLIADYLDVQNLPENFNVDVSGTIYWGGSCGTFMCRANIDEAQPPSSMRWYTPLTMPSSSATWCQISANVLKPHLQKRWTKSVSAQKLTASHIFRI